MTSLLLKVVVVGRMKDKHLAAKCDEYIKRLSAYGKVELVELKDSDVQDESRRIMRNIDPARDLVIALGEEGRSATSREFADLLRGAERRVTLIIGGAYGLTDEVKKSGLLLSLSPMTFTHEMARMLLLEQLYRAASILNNSGYHH